jgi:hypothetical protein
MKNTTRTHDEYAGLRFSQRRLWRVIFSVISTRVVCWLILQAWRCSLHNTPKHRLTLKGLHGVISQKTEIFTLRIWCHVYDVTIDGFWIDWIYWTFWYSLWLRFTVHCYRHTDQCPQSYLPLRCLVATSNCGRTPLPLGSRIIPSLSYQLLTAITHNGWTTTIL